jgi:hypothetical protein
MTGFDRSAIRDQRGFRWPGTAPLIHKATFSPRSTSDATAEITTGFCQNVGASCYLMFERYGEETTAIQAKQSDLHPAVHRPGIYEPDRRLWTKLAFSGG